MLTNMSMLNKIKHNFSLFADNPAFFIQDVSYSYSFLEKRVKEIQHHILQLKPKTENIGVLAHDDIDTYASILGILFSGYGFVPIHPNHPISRNKAIVENSKVSFVLSSRNDEVFECGNIVCTQNLISSEKDVIIMPRQENSNAYVLFTSGSTGLPKGVVISYENIKAFLNAFFVEFNDLGCNDRFLQMFDLTFDASIMHYMPALCVGGCTYTMPEGKVKFLYAYKLLNTHKITFSLMMPSTLSYLKPYFDQMNLPNLKYSLFGGEAVVYDLVEEWSKCVPNAKIFNAYGPTEASIFFLLYEWNKNKKSEKTNNGLMPIGKPMGDSIVFLFDENGDIIKEKGVQGEICIAGSQLTNKGYLGVPEKNISQFFNYFIDNQLYRFYKTGDVAYLDNDKNFVYCNRIDEQVQIDGHRIELSEIEHYARVVSSATATVAVAITSVVGTKEIVLFIENPIQNKDNIKVLLKNYLPKYMIPEKIIIIDKIPLTSNSKFDKKKLAEMATNS